MQRAPGRTDLRHFLAIALFALACFPSRGLYFLLHPAAPDGRYHTHHPVLGAPTQPTPRLKAAKVPLPARLTRVPRTLKKIPSVPTPAGDSAPARINAGRGARLVSPAASSLPPTLLPASPPSGRAPPSAA